MKNLFKNINNSKRKFNQFKCFYKFYSTRKSLSTKLITLKKKIRQCYLNEKQLIQIVPISLKIKTINFKLLQILSFIICSIFSLTCIVFLLSPWNVTFLNRLVTLSMHIHTHMHPHMHTCTPCTRMRTYTNTK